MGDTGGLCFKRRKRTSPVTSASGALKQDDCKFKLTLSNVSRPCVNQSINGWGHSSGQRPWVKSPIPKRREEKKERKRCRERKEKEQRKGNRESFIWFNKFLQK